MRAVLLMLIGATAAAGCAAGSGAGSSPPDGDVQDGLVVHREAAVDSSRKDRPAATPDRKVPPPDRKVSPPDKKVPQPDKKVPPPDKKVPPPDQKVPPPDQKVPQPDTKPGPTTLFSSDFESSGGGLTATGDWQWGTLAFAGSSSCSTSIAPPPSAHSGGKVWGTVLNDCYTGMGNADNPCSNVDPTDDSILRLELLIPSVYSTAKLEYWEWNDYFLNWDWAEVRVNDLALYQNCTSYVTPVWVKQSISLNQFVGQVVTIEFHFMATTVVNYSGWYIDDIVVTAQ